MFKRPITVREVTKHLGAVVDQLTAKHGNVTSPDFERELEERTGIHWKQVKNYRNNPDQNQVLRPNSKIKRFIYDNRKREFYRTLLSRRAITSVCAVFFIIVASYWYFSNPNRHSVRTIPLPKTAEMVATKHGFVPYQPKLKFSIPGFDPILQVGDITSQIKAIKWDSCMTNGELHRCSVNMGKPLIGRLDMSIQGDDVQAFTVYVSKKEIVDSLKDQIKKQTKADFTYNKKDGWWIGVSEMFTITESRAAYSPDVTSLVLFVMGSPHRAAK